VKTEHIERRACLVRMPGHQLLGDEEYTYSEVYELADSFGQVVIDLDRIRSVLHAYAVRLENDDHYVEIAACCQDCGVQHRHVRNCKSLTEPQV
jgi:hypothetical protein